MLGQRFQRLNALAQINSASTYLEIGVAKGNTFLNINVPFKIAVDPKFRFEIDAYKDKNTIFYEITSDEFFCKHALDYPKFDLIYLDGLHTFEQTFRDFCVSLRHSHEQTIWLIDDTVPVNFLSSLPQLERFNKLRKITEDPGRDWMGDVFKVVFAIHDFFPQFNYATFPNHGQTALWYETRQDFMPVWDSLEKINRLGYDDFLEYKDLMKIIKAPELLNLITTSLKK
jgi:hypothetical protein